MNILIEKDPSNLIAKSVTAEERAAWAVDFKIYDVNADGTKSAGYGPTRARLEEGLLYVDSLNAIRTGAAGAQRSTMLTSAQVAAVVAALPATSTWANRADLVTAGSYTAFFTDVGVGGSVWTYSGGRWRPYGGQCVLKNLVTSVSNNLGPKVVLDYATLPAGIWQDGDIIVADVVKERTGGTSDTDATDMMLGTVAATLGTTLNLSTSSLATTTISMALQFRWRRESSTSVRSQAVAGAVGFGTSNAANSLITGLANLDSTETYLQVTSDLTTAGGEVAWLRGYTVKLVAGA